jgi:adenine/guanine phosphoribosyltransferase-like PRPP-binding protein
VYYWDRKKTDIFLSSVVDLCRELEVNTVAGPVMSGAVMAASVATVASRTDKPVTALLLNKAGGKYEPAKHCSGVRKIFITDAFLHNKVKVLLIDDVVSTGDAMVHAIGEVQGAFPNAIIVALVSGNGWYKDAMRKVKGRLSNVRFFGSWNGSGLEEMFEERGD